MEGTLPSSQWPHGAEAEVVFDMVDGTGDFALPVDPLDKLATTWAGIKTKY